MKSKNIRISIILGIILLSPLFLTHAQSSGKSIINSVLNKVTQTSKVQPQDLTGEWNYQGSACHFESNNILKNMGGAVAAEQVENQFDNYLSKIGIGVGTCKFAFSNGNTYNANLGKMPLNGKYTVEEATKQITLTYKGMAKIHGTVKKSGNNLQLLFDADNLLKLLKIASSMTNDSKLKAITTFTDMYDGLQLGFDLKKQ
ncbi:DUF4923 family protein [Limibacterium fermenti]|uniref:DUF4923 family protein n=1 Tax=Limibacterium fermenti TaxID=3229863 RepID=UPI000E8D8894|nr:DUF4923 domain-containing protein [Porphyromonadaceae bacterium]